MAGNGDDNVDLAAREAAQQRENIPWDAEEVAIRDVQNFYEEERANNFELKQGLLQILQNYCVFRGKPNKNPNTDLMDFEDIMNTFQYNGVSQDVVYLRAFPFSLKDDAEEWLRSLPSGSMRTWEEMTGKFLDRYFSLAKTGKIRKEIHNFCKKETETDFWEGLTPASCRTLSNEVRGPLMKKTPNEIVTILDELSEDANQWPSESIERLRSTCVHQVDTNTFVKRQQFQPQQHIQSGIEYLMKAFILKTYESLETHRATIRDHGAAIKELGTGFRNLERQVGQLATLLSDRIPGTLPAESDRNPKEIVNVVTLRSEKVLIDPTPIQNDVKLEKESGEQLKNDVDKKKKGPRKTEKRKKDEKSRRGGGGTCEERPYEILTKKRKIEESLVVKLTKHCSSILQNKLRQKCEDPGSFTIPCSVGSINLDKSLCDSGASINLLPLSIYIKLEKEIGEIKSVPISLQLADQMTLIPEGIAEDVLVRVDKFVFPANFIVVKMEEN
ncbi:uncharacterized protein [Nicotiana tomentosiformis]|uniref:uncharacterized protein n=1 Tax=Nicotiana tomentosiformis TaxID=4098 RepID=UPI00388CA696